jgi:hypothetical protein
MFTTKASPRSTHRSTTRSSFWFASTPAGATRHVRTLHAFVLFTTLLAFCINVPPLAAAPATQAASAERRLSWTVKVRITDHESWPVKDKHASGRYEGNRVISNSEPSDLKHIVKECCGEIRVEIDLRAHLTKDGNIRVEGEVWLYEGTNQKTDDLDGIKSFRVDVRRNSQLTHELTVYNDDEGGDKAKITLVLNNKRP